MAAADINPGDTAWVLISSALVFVMTPGLAFFYAGLVRAKGALNLIMQNIMAHGVLTIQWFFWGYSLAFAHGGPIYGTLSKMFLSETAYGDTHVNAPTIPEMLYATYMMMFAIICPVLISGATADRFKFHVFLIFTFLWNTLVYCPIAHWVWHPDGWLFQRGILDFAGGYPVHLTAGTTALVAVLMLGKRTDVDPKAMPPPHSAFMVVVGTALLWFGWFGFNAGSAVSAGSQATIAFIASHLAAAFAGVTWMCLEWWLKGKPSATGTCCGFIFGLVIVTPMAGYVWTLPAMAVGIVAPFVGMAAIRLREKLELDDAVDVVACHGVTAVAGNLLTGIFADNELVGVPNTASGGWINQHYQQLWVQFYACICVAGWSAVMTYCILKGLGWIFGGIRVDSKAEAMGLDMAIHGEHADGFVVDVLRAAGFLGTAKTHVGSPSHTSVSGDASVPHHVPVNLDAAEKGAVEMTHFDKPTQAQALPQHTHGPNHGSCVTCDVLCSQLYNHAHSYIPSASASSVSSAPASAAPASGTHTIVITM